MESEEDLDEMSIRKQSAEHLWNIGNYLSSSCPPVSRFIMSTLERKLNEYPDLLKKSNRMYCRHCGAIWNSENCRIRVQPRPHKNRHISKLLSIESWKLNNRQKQKLRRFEEARSKTVYNCLICKKKTLFWGSKTRNIKRKSVEPSDMLQPKIKLNKKDVNAGLYIPSSSVKSNTNNKNSTVKSKAPETLPTSGVSPERNTSKPAAETSSVKNQTPPGLRAGNSKKQSAGKKKKTLLSQISSQEQNGKKKISLSSFLVSL